MEQAIEQTHQMIEVGMDSNEIIFASIEECNIVNPQNEECNENSMQLYDWLADCETMSYCQPV